MLTCSTIYSLIKNFYLRIYISAKETKYLSHFQHTFEATFFNFKLHKGTSNHFI